MCLGFWLKGRGVGDLDLEIDVDGAVEVIVEASRGLGESAGDRRELGDGKLVVGGYLGEEAVHGSADLLYRGRAAYAVEAGTVEHAVAGAGLSLGKAGHDPASAVWVHDTVAGVVQSDGEEVGYRCLVEGSGGPALELPPAGRGGAEEDRGAEEAADEADGEGGFAVRRENGDEGFEEAALAGAGVTGGGGSQGAGGKGEKVRQGLLSVGHDGGGEGFRGGAAGFHAGEDLLERGGRERRELAGPPVRRRSRRKVSLVAGLQADDVHGAADDPSMLRGSKEIRSVAGAEQRDGGRERLERRLADELLGPLHQVPAAVLFRHLQVLGGAPERRHVVDGYLEIKPIAELSCLLEHVRAARNLRQIHAPQVGPLRLHHLPPDQPALRHQHKLHPHTSHHQYTDQEHNRKPELAGIYLVQLKSNLPDLDDDVAGEILGEDPGFQNKSGNSQNTIQNSTRQSGTIG